MDYMELIRRYMDVNNISYQSLAEKIGTSRQNLWRILNQNKTITLNSLEKICDGLGLQVIIREKQRIRR